MSFGYVYISTNKINGKKYIGLKYGKFNPRYFGSGKLLKQALKKYGRNNFTVELLEVCETKEELRNCEIKHIKAHNAKNSPNYYNMIDSLSCCQSGAEHYLFGKHVSEEVKKKISMKHKGMKMGETHYKKLKEMWEDPEYKKSISAKLKKIFNDPEIKNKIFTKEYRNAVSTRFKGKKHTEETKEKMRLTQKNIVHWWQDKVNKNPDKIKNMALKHRGMKRSVSTKEKFSLIHKGKPTHNKGCVYYHNPKTRDYIKLKVDDPIPENYIRGIGKSTTFIKNEKYEVLTEAGFKNFEGINFARKKTIVVKTTTKELCCTDDHLIMTDAGWKRAIDLTHEDIIKINGKSESVEYITFNKEKMEVADLVDVADTKSFYANDILVHNCVFLDEYAFVEENIANEFFTATLPTLTSGTKTKMFVMSTPNGLNHFYKLWSEAEKGKNGFVPIRIDWWQVPGRDEEWKQKELQKLGQDKFDQEYSNTFLGSVDTLISANFIQNMVDEEPIKRENDFYIYEDVKPDHKYLITVDCAEGVGLDYSAFSVIDITAYPFKQVATFFSNKITYIQYPSIIYNCGMHYNEADVLVENNSIGSAVCYALNYELEYPSLISLDNKDIGVRTTKKTKRLGLNNFKMLVESRKLEIKDKRTIEELSWFVRKNNSYEAESGADKHDDLVMGLVNFAYFVSTESFDDYSVKTMREELLKEDDIEDLLPFGFMSNGVDDILPNS